MRRSRIEDSGALVTTPLSATMIVLMGPGISSGNVVLTRSEYQAVLSLYEFKKEEPSVRPPEPTPPKPPGTGAGPEDVKAYRRLKDKYDGAMENWRKWQDPLPLMQAGAARDAIRCAGIDGLRLLAWIAKYVEPGHDPLKTLIQFAVDSGIAVSSEDYDWAETDEDDERDGEVT